jgi:hypothetical protein
MAGGITIRGRIPRMSFNKSFPPNTRRGVI